MFYLPRFDLSSQLSVSFSLYIFLSTLLFLFFYLPFSCLHLRAFILLTVVRSVRWSYCVCFLSFPRAIIGIRGFSLVTSTIYRVPFSPPVLIRVRVSLYFRARCRALSISGANCERPRESRTRFGDGKRNYDTRTDDNLFSPLLAVNS